MRTFKKNTSQSATQWAPNEPLLAGRQAIDALVPLINEIEATAVLPLLERLIVLMFLGKVTGGERPIGSLGWLYRLITRLRAWVPRSWDSKRAGFWDSAIRGSSALRAAMLRAFRCEMAVRAGLDATALLWDLSAFYEMIQWVPLLEVALDTGYDPLDLALGMQQHLGPRTLVADSYYSEWLEADRVIAGCSQAPTWSRCILLDILEAVHAAWPSAGQSQHIDDLAQVVDGTSDYIFDTLTPAATHLSEALERRGFQISDKTAILPTSSPGARRVFARLRDSGMPIKIAARDRDIGADATGGRSRRVGVQRLRYQDARKRVLKNAHLGKADSKAKKLYKPGALAKSRWGLPVFGASWAHMKTHRSMGLQAAGRLQSGRSAYVQTLLVSGLKNDPVVSLYTEQLKAWSETWLAAAALAQTRCN